MELNGSIAHGVWTKARCKPVFPVMQTLAGRENFKWPSKQHCSQVYGWQYHPWSPNHNLWLLGRQSQVSLRNKWWEGEISFCPLQRMSKTSMLNSVIYWSQSPILPLRQRVSKSLVHSSCVKIMHWAKPNNEQWAKRLLLGQKFLETGFSLTLALPQLLLLVVKSIGYLSSMTVAISSGVSFWKRSLI